MELQAQLDSEAPSSSSSRSTSPEANGNPTPDWADDLNSKSANSGAPQRPAARDATWLRDPSSGYTVPNRSPR